MVSGHQVEIFTFGRDLYAAMISDSESAQHTDYLETFIWKNDEVGRHFRQALVEAAARGVKVYAMWDTFANQLPRNCANCTTMMIVTTATAVTSQL